MDIVRAKLLEPPRRPGSVPRPRLVARLERATAVVARGYGIPAELGTGSATGRVKDGGHFLTVDGDAGSVGWDEHEPVPTDPPPGARAPSGA